MAFALASRSPVSFSSCFHSSSNSSSISSGVLPFRTRSNRPFVTLQSDEETSVFFDELSPTRRRDALLRIVLSAAGLALLPARALAEIDLQEDFRTYEDETNKFLISIPQGWLVGTGEANGIKSITAFYPEETSDSNVSVVITGVGADFTRLESFGTADAFAESLVNGLDRSWQRPPGLAAKLIDSKAANGLYYLEYTLQNPGERRRHILSAVGMASNGWYNRLYTVTGQFMEDESDNYRTQIEKIDERYRHMNVGAVYSALKVISGEKFTHIINDLHALLPCFSFTLSHLY